MTATLPTAAPAVSRPATPRGGRRLLRRGLSRIGFEVRSYFRQGDSVFFTFLFPVLFLLIFAVAFSSDTFGPPGDEVSSAAYYLPGMLAAGLLLSGTQNLAIDIAMERSDGTLKRLGGTPLSPISYFIGKLGQVLVTGALQAALLIAVAVLAFGVDLPTEPERWATFAWVFLLGVTTCAILGIGLSAIPRSGRSATAVVIPIVLVLQFISGVFIQFSVLPEWLQNIASVFPLKWLAQGMRSVFLPEAFATAEATGSWEHGLTLLVTLAWLVGGLIVVRATFRWIRKDG
ncbi:MULTISPECIES: ABC transporter permease [Microbacterium]|uniref:ABC transporter permease n=1 Tax=Microbacterium wangchenii TaxID=2541726 RepID=A0ABX5SVL4_9MICO|nr:MULTISPECIES: ABC transporter permease [Microbacterium]MCK6065925.1 ABC transporter permease [Microbacterium sp. EYE_512]QBR90225.1 ABC transporter permease [Microbacterium wangchenii]TFV84965.1 ABC transporter permease [Microbacterium sp. dk485]TXK11760.1 ABC transporter permease [Microbacterium wangchenii]